MREEQFFELQDQSVGSVETKITKSTGKNNSVQGIRAELDAYFEEMKNFEECQVDEIFLKLSSWTARASELRMLLYRDSRAQASALRSREIEPFIEECERQFRYHSRRHAVMEMDFKMSGGQV